MSTATLSMSHSGAFSSSAHGALTSTTSPADSLPTINFGFEELRARMNNFTQRFDDFIEKGRKRVLEERNQFRMSVAQVQEDQQSHARSLTSLTQQSHSHAAQLSAQSAEAAEMHSAITSLTATRDTHLSSLATLRSRLASTRSAVAARKAAQRRHADYLKVQSGADAPELAFWEEVLGMRVEGTGVEDRVRFVFTVKGGREASFELEMPGAKKSAYEVLGCEPKVEMEKVEACLARMNGGKEDLAGFLKEMRGLFVVELA